MTKKYVEEEYRIAMLEKRERLMRDAADCLKSNNDLRFYGQNTHAYLDRCGESMFPLDKEEWPDIFRGVLCDPVMKWPYFSVYNYIMSVLAPPFVPYLSLYFGYVILDDQLIRSAFFVTQRMVDYQDMPQGMVIDPMARRQGYKPLFYIGCFVGEDDINNFLESQKNPIEAYVARISKKMDERDLFNLKIEALNHQLACYPEYVTPEMEEFAQKNGIIY